MTDELVSVSVAKSVRFYGHGFTDLYRYLHVSSVWLNMAPFLGASTSVSGSMDTNVQQSYGTGTIGVLGRPVTGETRPIPRLPRCL